MRSKEEMRKREIAEREEYDPKEGIDEKLNNGYV